MANWSYHDLCLPASVEGWRTLKSGGAGMHICGIRDPTISSSSKRITESHGSYVGPASAFVFSPPTLPRVVKGNDTIGG